MSVEEPAALAFSDLALSEKILAALNDVGYETPTAIQAETIPLLLAGRDVFGEAQTGTGKTAAFALPLLNNIDLAIRDPQALVLAPTRELAIQVAEAFQRYAKHMPGFHVLPVYGGQEYGVQLRALKRGVHVVVGTPGRVMDHMRRNTLNLSDLRFLVLDEGDEMLRMGFIDDIEWILEQTPPGRQTALFSATMPPQIRKIAERYLEEPAEIRIRLKTSTAATIRQRFWMVRGLNKLDALTRILESENFEGVLIFVRTKTATVELSERLEARGYTSNAINGDMPQRARERTIEQLKDGKLDILVATDVAARGLDVERVSHVINFDIPYDPEAYVHRIGRTGRAGRHGDAILFVAPRETRMLRLIERVTRQPIEEMDLPSTELINDNRRSRFMSTITETLANENLELFTSLVSQYEREHEVEPIMIAAALAKLLQGDEPLLLEDRPRRKERPRDDHNPRARRDERERPQSARGERNAPRGAGEWPARREERERPASDRNAPRGDRERPARSDEGERAPFARPDHNAPRGDSDRPAGRDEGDRPAFARPDHNAPRGDSERPARRDERDRPPSAGADGYAPRSDGERPPRREPRPRERGPEAGKETFRIEAGHVHNVQPGNIVGAIANEAGLDSSAIGRIDIFDEYSTVDLPEGMPKEILSHLKRVWVAGQQMQISRISEAPGKSTRGKRDVPIGTKPRTKDRHRDRKNKGAPKRS